MDWYLIWLMVCGICANAWMGWHLGRGLVHCAWAAVEAASIIRWVWAVGRVHGWKKESRLPQACYAPVAFVRAWWLSIKEPAVTIRLTTGAWRGVGNWTVFPRGEK